MVNFWYFPGDHLIVGDWFWALNFIVFTNLDAVEWGYDNADTNTGRVDFTNALIFLRAQFFPSVPRIFLLFWMRRIVEIVMILLVSFHK